MAPCHLVLVRLIVFSSCLSQYFYQVGARMLKPGRGFLIPSPKKEHLDNKNLSLNLLVLTSLESWAWKQSHTTSVSATTVLPSTRITTIIIIPLSPQTSNNCRAMSFQSRYFVQTNAFARRRFHLRPSPQTVILSPPTYITATLRQCKVDIKTKICFE